VYESKSLLLEVVQCFVLYPGVPFNKRSPLPELLAHLMEPAELCRNLSRYIICSTSGDVITHKYSQYTPI
jgi:hypothetical protein